MRSRAPALSRFDRAEAAASDSVCRARSRYDQRCDADHEAGAYRALRARRFHGSAAKPRLACRTSAG
jgi:hypothetical protein